MTQKEKLQQFIRDTQGVLAFGAPTIKKESVISILSCIAEDLEKIKEAPMSDTYHEKDDCDWSRL